MSSWREKLGSFAKKVVKTAQNNETLNTAYNAVSKVTQNVRQSISTAVEGIIPSAETSQVAVGADGNYYSMSAQTAVMEPSIIFQRAPGRARARVETEKEREERELKAMIPTTNIISDIRDEISEVFCSIKEGIGFGGRKIIAPYLSGTRSIISDEWGDVKNTLASMIGRGGKNPHTPKQKRIPRTPPNGHLNFNSQGTGRKQSGYIKPEAPKEPQAPKGPNHRKYQLAIAGLAAIAAGVFLYPDKNTATTEHTNTSSVATSSASNTPENKTIPVPKPTVTQTVAPQPEEPKTVEMTPAPKVEVPVKENITDTTPNIRYAKTKPQPKKTIINPQPVDPSLQELIDMAKEAKPGTTELPNNMLAYTDAMRINGNLMTAVYEMRKNIELARELDKKTDERIRSFGGTMTVSSEFATKYEDILKGLRAVEDQHAIYNSHVRKLPGAREVARQLGGSFDSLYERKFTDDTTWTETNAARQLEYINTYQQLFAEMEKTRMVRLAEAQKNAYDRYYAAAVGTFGQIADKSMRTTYGQTLETINKRVTGIYGEQTSESREVAIVQGIRGVNTMDRNVSEVHGLLNAIRSQVLADRMSSQNNRTALTNSGEQKTHIASAPATRAPLRLRSLQSPTHTQTRAQAEPKTNGGQQPGMKMAPVWTPTEI